MFGHGIFGTEGLVAKSIATNTEKYAGKQFGKSFKEVWKTFPNKGMLALVAMLPIQGLESVARVMPDNETIKKITQNPIIHALEQAANLAILV